ncbi:CAP domain-containing protein [Actinoplanes sp. NPDC049265]|uniref:CAP domain-containing protein n=1 Tax=Actinoplanes sp. NPDC049265 TaxID=3363902 RepID=UPI00371CD9AA
MEEVALHQPIAVSTGHGRHHRGRRTPPVPVALGLTVVGLLAAFGGGAALLPASFTGSGTPLRAAGAGSDALAPGAGGGAPGVRAVPPAPSNSAPANAAPANSAPVPGTSPSAPAASPKPKPTASSKPATKTSTKPAAKVTTKKTTAAAKVAPGLTGQEAEVIRLTNVERDKAGCGPVELDTRLRTAMRLHVTELGKHGNLYISHVSDDGRSFVDRARAQGYNDAGGENVARGQGDAAGVMTSWMNSEGHRANILNCSFKSIGVGAVKASTDGTIVWGQIFGRS